MNETATPCDRAMAMWLRNLVARSRLRAGRAGFRHELRAGFAAMLFERQRGRCAVSGLPFSLRRFDGVLVKHPFAPSLDRISSQSGYTADNVRLVCTAVNFGMGQWGEELYLIFARAAVEHSQQAAHFGPRTGTVADAMVDAATNAEWRSQQQEHIAAAEAIAATLSGELLLRQRRRIASLRRNLTLGPDGLRAAA